MPPLNEITLSADLSRRAYLKMVDTFSGACTRWNSNSETHFIMKYIIKYTTYCVCCEYCVAVTYPQQFGTVGDSTFRQSLPPHPGGHLEIISQARKLIKWAILAIVAVVWILITVIVASFSIRATRYDIKSS